MCCTSVRQGSLCILQVAGSPAPETPQPGASMAARQLRYLKIGAAAVGGGALLAITGVHPLDIHPAPLFFSFRFVFSLAVGGGALLAITGVHPLDVPPHPTFLVFSLFFSPCENGFACMHAKAIALGTGKWLWLIRAQIGWRPSSR
jgi:hypothetical protein